MPPGTALAFWVLTLALSVMLTAIHAVVPSNSQWPGFLSKLLGFSAFLGSWTVTTGWRQVAASSHSLTPLRWQRQCAHAWWQWQATLLAMHVTLLGVLILKQEGQWPQASVAALLLLGGQALGVTLAWGAASWSRRPQAFRRMPWARWWSSLRVVDTGTSRQGQPLSVWAVLAYLLFIPALASAPAAAFSPLSLPFVSVVMLCAARCIVSPHVATSTPLMPGRRQALRHLRGTLFHTYALWTLVSWGLWLVILLGIWAVGQWPIFVSAAAGSADKLKAFLQSHALAALWQVAMLAFILWLMARLPDKPLWRSAVLLTPALLGLFWVTAGWFNPLLWHIPAPSLPDTALAPLALTLLLLWDAHLHWPAALQQTSTPAYQ